MIPSRMVTQCRVFFGVVWAKIHKRAAVTRHASEITPHDQFSDSQRRPVHGFL